MQSLVRTKVARFGINDAITLTQLEEARDAGTLMSSVVPVEEMFDTLPKVFVLSRFQTMIENGNVFAPNMCAGDAPEGEVRVYNEEGRFYGVYVYKPEIHAYKPVKMFL